MNHKELTERLVENSRITDLIPAVGHMFTLAFLAAMEGATNTTNVLILSVGVVTTLLLSFIIYRVQSIWKNQQEIDLPFTYRFLCEIMKLWFYGVVIGSLTVLLG